MSERRKSGPRRHIQYAALPYRAARASVEIMLVTSRTTRRWIIPKGWPKAGMAPHELAAKEAYEEAGVAGKVSEHSIGSYSYNKVLKQGDTARCSVHVFPLEVTRQHRSWPEKQERQIGWYTPDDAARFVGEPYLRRIIRRFAKRPT